MRTLPWLPFILTAPLLVAAAGCSPRAAEAPAPRIARVAKIEPADAVNTTMYPGAVRARHESALGFRVGGKISQRLVDVGAHVSRGQVLVELDPSDFELSVTRARAALSSAESALKLAKSEHERYQNLARQGFVSQLALEAKTSAYEAAKAQASEARAALATTHNQADYTELKADADGVITGVSGEPGQVVGAGQAVIMLAHDGASEVEIDVPEHQIGALSVEQPALVELWTESGTQHAAQVREIAPAADPITRTYRVRVALNVTDSEPRLGQTARVYFQSALAAGGFQVPLSAVYELDGKSALWKFDPGTGTVHLQPVEIASYAEKTALVSSNIAHDTWIVTAGVHRLREGEVVKPIDALNKPLTF
jgi:multidrug efflux system membrane fusion protein